MLKIKIIFFGLLSTLYRPKMKILNFEPEENIDQYFDVEFGGEFDSDGPEAQKTTF